MPVKPVFRIRNSDRYIRHLFKLNVLSVGDVLTWALEIIPSPFTSCYEHEAFLSNPDRTGGLLTLGVLFAVCCAEQKRSLSAWAAPSAAHKAGERPTFPAAGAGPSRSVLNIESRLWGIPSGKRLLLIQATMLIRITVVKREGGMRQKWQKKDETWVAK